MATGKTFTAPRCRILLEGKVVARGTNFTMRCSEEVQDVDVIDSVETIEYATVGYKVSGSIGRVKSVGTTVKSLGMFPNTGKDAEEHLSNILAMDGQVLQAMDKGESKVLHTITGVKFTDWDFSIAARGIGAVNVMWRAIRETDESEPS